MSETFLRVLSSWAWLRPIADAERCAEADADARQYLRSARRALEPYADSKPWVREWLRANRVRGVKYQVSDAPDEARHIIEGWPECRPRRGTEHG